MTTKLPEAEIADCGHSHCYNMRVASGTRWCQLNHPLMVGLRPDGLSALMAAVSSAAGESYRRGHISTSISQWKLLLMLETAARLTDDAAATAGIIGTLENA